MVTKECEGLSVSESVELCRLMVNKGNAQQVFSSWAADFITTPVSKKNATGWTSWYNYYEHVTEEIVRANLHEFKSRNIPIDYMQIDDGWQQAVGDWLLVNDSFLSGLTSLAREIREAGYTPGLWRTPFAAEESSQVCTYHADWIVSDKKGGFVKAGYNPDHWSGMFYSLNIDLPEVREYLREAFRTNRDNWGFGLVKLDFLYAAAVVPRDGKSRGQIMCEKRWSC